MTAVTTKYDGPLPEPKSADKALMVQATHYGRTSGELLFLDGGACAHVAQDENQLINIREKGDGFTTLQGAFGGEPVVITKMGDLPVVLQNTLGDPVRLLIKGVAVAPTMTSGPLIISYNKLVLDGTLRMTNSGQLFVSKPGPEEVAYAPLMVVLGPPGTCLVRHDDIYAVEEPLQTNAIRDKNTHQRITRSLAHRRFGHVGDSTLDKVGDNTEGVDLVSVKGMSGGLAYHLDASKECGACKLGKMQRSRRHAASETVPVFGHLVGMDPAGKNNTSGMNGERYFSVINDVHTGYTYVHLHKTKAEGPQALQYFYNNVVPFKHLRCDNETKSIVESSGLHNTLNFGIQPSAPYEQWQNGSCERRVGIVKDMARTMIIAGEAPDTLWTYAVKAAAHILNRMPSARLGNKTPIEAATSKPPNISHLRTLFCRMWKRNNQSTGSVLSPKGIEGIFAGYAQDDAATSSGHAWLFYEPKSHRVTTTTNATFDENIMPFAIMHKSTPFMNRRVRVPLSHNSEVIRDGVIVSYIDHQFKVAYSDGDREDLNITEVQKFLVDRSDVGEDRGESQTQLPTGLQAQSQQLAQTNAQALARLDLDHPQYDSHEHARGSTQPYKVGDTISFPNGYFNTRGVPDVGCTGTVVRARYKPKGGEKPLHYDVRFKTDNAAGYEIWNLEAISIEKRTKIKINTISKELPSASEPNTNTPTGNQPQKALENKMLRDSLKAEALTQYVMPTSEAGELEYIAFIKSLPKEDQEDIEKLATSPDPQSYQEAMRSENKQDWMAACEKELNAMSEFKTFTDVDTGEVKPGDKVIGSKFVWKTKHNSDGTIDKFKCRLVVLGYRQIAGTHYNTDEVFSPTANASTVMMLIAYAATHALPISHIDFSSAFLQGDELDETIFMRLPKMGFEEQRIVRLLRPLYGLVQAGRKWHNSIATYLIERLGFVRCCRDSCLFIWKSTRGFILCAMHVDDFIVVGSAAALKDDLVESLKSAYKCTDLGALKWFLGMEVNQDPEGSITLNQTQYISKILERFGMSDCNAAKTPLCPSSLLMPKETLDELETEPTGEKCTWSFRAVVGALLYATKTRPDITAAVGMLAQYSHNPHPLHFTYLKRVLRYLRGTLNKGIRCNKTGHFIIEMYCDSNHADHTTGDGKSRSCIMAMVNGMPIVCSSKKQKRVAKSSTEAEFICLSSGVVEALYLRQVAAAIGAPQTEPTVIHEDNRACEIIAHHQFCQNRSKYFEIEPALTSGEMQDIDKLTGANLVVKARKAVRVDVSLVKDEVQVQKSVAIKSVPTQDNIADIGTKVLGAQRLQYLMSLCMSEVKSSYTR